MQLFKRVGATILVVLVVVSITASCFATPVAITGIDFFTAAFQTFIEICGLTSVVSSNGVNSSSSDPYSQLQLTDQYQSLYDEYQATLPTQQSMSDWYTTYKDSIYVNIDSETSVISPTIDAVLSEWFSGFAGWILEDKYNAVRTDSGFSHTAGTFDSPLSSVNTFSIDGVAPYSLVNGVTVANAVPFGQYRFVTARVDSWNNFWANGTVYIWNNGSGFSALSFDPFYVGVRINNGSSGYSALNGQVSTSLAIGTYYVADISAYNGDLSTGSLAVINKTTSQLVSSDISSVADTISLRPKDKYNEDVLPVPNVESDTYVPQAVEGEYSDVITGALEGVVSPTLDDILQAVLEAVTENTEVIADEKVDPAPVNPVMPPFMPFDLPSFDFNLSGIWYYVTRWVASIGSGAALVFNVFSNIPPAMFYPVFGSAVVVIVIGVWKRFIA